MVCGLLLPRLAASKQGCAVQPAWPGGGGRPGDCQDQEGAEGQARPHRVPLHDRRADCKGARPRGETPEGGARLLGACNGWVDGKRLRPLQPISSSSTCRFDRVASLVTIPAVAAARTTQRRAFSFMMALEAQTKQWDPPNQADASLSCRVAGGGSGGKGSGRPCTRRLWRTQGALPSMLEARIPASRGCACVPPSATLWWAMACVAPRSRVQGDRAGACQESAALLMYLDAWRLD